MISINKIKSISLFVFIFTLGSNLKAMQQDQKLKIEKIKINTNRRKANLIDAGLFTFIAQTIESVAKNSDMVSLGKNSSIGIASWLIGEGLESGFKSVYKKIKGKNLRDSLGKVVIFGVEFDLQRSLRRAITLLVVISIKLYELRNS